MSEITRAAIARVGVDLAKNVIQVHAVDGASRRVAVRAIKRGQFLASGLTAGVGDFKQFKGGHPLSA